ncbi:MAG: S41 family peptidase [Fibromonadales bacterium]|nr:S41 family peptidase [Fibromonadales bacterium]
MRFIAIFFSLLLAACGDIVPSSEGHELYQSYHLLKAYFYKPERIKEFAEYEGMEVGDMYKSMDDHYTYYTPPKESEEKKDQIENTPRYYSFGFERVLINDTLVVSQVYPFSPANSAGLKKHDKLLFANEVSLTDKTAAFYLNSDSLFETTTTFKVLRGAEVTMKKAEVQVPSVFLDSLDGIPYITVTTYKMRANNPNGTYAEFKSVLQEIKGAKTAIMDLRNNGGGSINHCTAMAAELVPFDSELIYDIEHFYDSKRGNVIDTVRSFASDYVKSEGIGASIDWTFYINGESASCTERFVAAVKYNRPETVVLGTRSYGKGIGQVYSKTYLGGLAYITCLQSFYPNWETFHEVGIEPDGPISLAKRLPEFLPERKTNSSELGAYKYRSFHEWE